MDYVSILVITSYPHVYPKHIKYKNIIYIYRLEGDWLAQTNSFFGW